MKIGTVTFLAFLGLFAVVSATEDNGDRELWMSPYERKKYRQEMKKKRQERKRKKMLRKKKHYYTPPSWKYATKSPSKSSKSSKSSSKSSSSSSYDKDHYDKDHYDKDHYVKDHYVKPYYEPDTKHHGGGEECVLTACISLYPKDHGHYRYSNMHPGYRSHHKWSPPSWSSSSSWSSSDDGKPDVSGKVKMSFDNYLAHRIGQNPPFTWYFDLKGLNDGDEGIVHLFDENTCRFYQPTSRKGFYNHFVQVNRSPWTEEINYHADSKGKAKGKYYINNGWPCESAIGKTAFVEIPGTEYYGCGVMMKGDYHC